jgi:hypothetical protein
MTPNSEEALARLAACQGVVEVIIIIFSSLLFSLSDNDQWAGPGPLSSNEFSTLLIADLFVTIELIWHHQHENGKIIERS